MVTALMWVLQGLQDMGLDVLIGSEEFATALLTAIVSAWTLITSVLPKLSDAPAIQTGQWLNWLNWFYPLTSVVETFGSCLGIYTGFLAVRFVLRIIRQA